MSVEVIYGDIFEIEADILVNPVNCVGVMGKGLALQFKKRFPDMFVKYKENCSDGFQPGELFCSYTNDKLIVNFPTKNHWKDKSEYHYISDGLEALTKVLSFVYTLTTNPIIIAMPALGCGLGGLEFSKVKELIENEFKDSVHKIIIVLKGK